VAIDDVDGWINNVVRHLGPQAPEGHPPALHVDILAFKPGVLPRLGHDVVLRIVTPPRAVLRGASWQLRPDHAFDFVEGHPDDRT
jgi:hypothetical protein